MLKDPGAAYYVYECSGEPGRVTGVVAICPVGALAGGDAVAADTTAAARAIADLKVQPRPVSLAYEASPVMDIILGAAKEGASLYAVTDPAGITHRAWEVKREDAVGAIRAMLDQAPEPALADDPAYAAALTGASQLLADEARSAGTYTGKEPVLARPDRPAQKSAAQQTGGGDAAGTCISAPFASRSYAGDPCRRARVIRAADLQ